MFPSALAGRLIECFTQRGMTVLDPFLGVGSTLIAAKRLGRNGIGTELNPEYARVALQRLQADSLEQHWDDSQVSECKVIVGDANELDQLVAPETIDLVVTSPPCWDILLEKRTADYLTWRSVCSSWDSSTMTSSSGTGGMSTIICVLSVIPPSFASIRYTNSS